MKEMFISGVLFFAVSGLAGEFSDDFNRANTADAKGSRVSKVIGSGWAGSGEKNWAISNNEVIAGTGDGNFLYYSAEKLTVPFEVSADITPNRPAVFNGVAVHYNPEKNSGLIFRYQPENGQLQFCFWDGSGKVLLGHQMLRNAFLPSGAVSERDTYRLSVASKKANTYDLKVSKPDGTVLFSTTVETGAANISGGYAGLFVSSNTIVFDNFKLTTSSK